MARIVLATMGSLGDLHPMLALALELQKRGHDAVIATWEGYREKIEGIGLGFHSLRPNVDQDDPELNRKVMDAQTGPETVIRHIIFPSLRDMYDDLASACDGADLMINGEIVYAASSLFEKTGIKWISTTLAPLSMFSSYDPNVYPAAPWLDIFRPFPVLFHQKLFEFLRWMLRDWLEPFQKFRRDLGLSDNIDPIFTDKYSPLLNLALFSKALAKPQPDWYSPTLQTGFCFYDEGATAELRPDLENFLASGEPPIVFTLGSAAVLDARDFFEESVKAAKILGRRALVIHGRENAPPVGLNEDIVAVDYAPYSRIFSKAAAVVHQGGVGTTAQALRAGVPQLIMPYSHDQPDNAARCRRAGVAEVIGRDSYNAANAARSLKPLLADKRFAENARGLKRIIDAENGTQVACDAIEIVLRK